MANSRELVECVASALELPLTEVTGHMRHLRDAKLVTIGGRGITAPRMTHEDAASLICSIYGSEMMKDGVESVRALKALPAVRQGRRTSERPSRHVHFREDLLGAEPTNGVVAGLAAALRLMGKEKEILRREEYRFYDYPVVIGVKFKVQFPVHYASLTASFAGVSEVWTFGRRGKPRTRRTRECDEEGLREIALCVDRP